jgi:hypothetical protein
MLAVVGAENSQRLLLVIALNSGVKLLLIWLSSDTTADTLLSMAFVFLSNASGSSMKFVRRSKPIIHYPA